MLQMHKGLASSMQFWKVCQIHNLFQRSVLIKAIKQVAEIFALKIGVSSDDTPAWRILERNDDTESRQPYVYPNNFDAQQSEWVDCSNVCKSRHSTIKHIVCYKEVSSSPSLMISMHVYHF